MEKMLAAHSNTFKRCRWPTAIVFLTVFAFLLRWNYVSTALVVHPIRGDAIQYVSYAWNLITHHTFSKDLPGSPSVTPDSYRDPGYPFFLSLLMKVFGNEDAWYASVLLSQALLGAVTVTLTTQLGKYWLNGRWALAAGLLMAVWPHSISISSMILSETLLSFLCAAGLLTFATAVRRQSSSWGLTSGALFGAAGLTNAVLLPFGFFLACFLASRKVTMRHICAAIALGALIFPCCWMLRNAQLPASAATDSSLERALLNFAQGASPDYHAAYRDSFFGDAVQKKRASVVVQEVNAQYSLLNESLPLGLGALFHQIEKQPFRYAFWYLIEKPHELWNWDIVVGQGDIYVYPTVNSPFQTKRPWIALEVICQSINFFLMLTAAVGTVSIISSLEIGKKAVSRDFGLAPLIALAFLLAFTTVVYCILQEEPRYSIPFRSFEILAAFTIISVAIRQWRKPVVSKASSRHHIQQ